MPLPLPTDSVWQLDTPLIPAPAFSPARASIFGLGSPVNGADPDPLIDQVIFLVNPSAQTGFTDLRGHLVTIYADATIAADPNGIGGVSANFPGLTATSRVEYTDDSRFTLGLQDFCLEFYASFSDPTGVGRYVIGQVFVGSDIFTSYGFTHSGASGTLSGFVYYAGTSTYSLATPAASVAINTRYHVALTRNNRDLRLFLNGVQVAYVQMTDAVNVQDSNLPLTLGSRNGGNSPAACKIQAVRFTRGSARYISGFTPPVIPFPNF